MPWFVPRSVSLGVFVNAPMVTPHFRLAWEAPIIAQPRNHFIWTVALGSGVGLGVQSPMTEHYQHTAIAGLGYRSDRELVHWGFHVGAGGTWYRAAYKPGSIYSFENRVVGYIEGRLQLGLRITERLKLALYFGYGSPFVFNRVFPGNTFVGGVDAGLVLDWR
ncbi:MAG: hypothetical protein ACOZQL_02860 [Myxococcota bacterium]